MAVAFLVIWVLGIVLWLSAWTTYALNVILAFLGSDSWRPVPFWRWAIPLIGGSVGYLITRL